MKNNFPKSNFFTTSLTEQENKKNLIELKDRAPDCDINKIRIKRCSLKFLSTLYL